MSPDQQKLLGRLATDTKILYGLVVASLIIGIIGVFT